ncbi:insulinase family protein [Paenibacillaceae bacterium]|nr:insulinase family protein [Paenibacillaceae bacterium]
MEKATLDNGMTIFTNTIPGSRLVVMHYLIKVGSFYEKKYSAGISHFIEHMLFNGTKNQSKEEILDCIEDLGGEINAYTSLTSTVYHCSLLNEHWKKGLELLSDIVWNSTLPEDSFENEKKVIIQEIRSLNSHPITAVKNAIFQNLFKMNPEKHSVIGTEESVREISLRQLQEYKNSHYIPNRAVLVISGDIQQSEIAEFLNSFSINDNNMKTINDIEDDNLFELNSETYKVSKAFEQGCLAIANFSPSKNSVDYYPYLFIESILADGLSSRLYRELRERLGIVYEIGMGHIELNNQGLSVFTALTNKENFEEVKEVFFKQAAILKKDLVSETELLRLKNKLLYNLLSSNQSIEKLNEDLLVGLLHRGYPLKEEDLISKIRSVTSEDIRQCANNYFISTNYMFIEMDENVDGKRDVSVNI